MSRSTVQKAVGEIDAGVEVRTGCGRTPAGELASVAWTKAAPASRPAHDRRYWEVA